MKRIIVFFLFLLVFGTLSAWDDFPQYSIADELKKPGVKLVAVDFYATWCEPCKAAIPKWKELQRKYGNKGFELIVVSVQSKGRCAQPPQWNPGKMVCDTDGKIADAWHAHNLPEAFLWSWDGNLLVSHGTVDNVAAAIENYFNKEPRILIEEGSDKKIYQLVRSELRECSKFEILPSKEEQKELKQVREESRSVQYNNKLRCELGQQVSANSWLKISRWQQKLVLDLHSAEKGCLMASGSAEMRGKIDAEVAKAVENLLKNLLGDVKMPEKEKKGVHDGSFGGLTPDDFWDPEYKEEAIVEFSSEPAGASVLVDGKMICQSTPCSRTLTEEDHEIEMQKEKYIPKKERYQISRGKSVKYNLDPDFALLSVTGKKMVEVILDGKSIGKIPIKEMEIKLGKHKIEQKDECFYPSGEIFTVKSGEKKTINLKLDDKESAVNIHAFNEKGDAMEADVYVDDKKVGSAPGTFKIPLCSRKLVVKNGDLEYSEELSLKEKQIKTIQAQLKRKTLQWSKRSPNTMDWSSAKQYCEDLSEGGFDDWRLPNIDELRTTIKNCSKTEPGGECRVSEKNGCLSWKQCGNGRSEGSCECEYRKNNGGYYSKLGDTDGIYLWSSSTSSGSTGNAWLVDFDCGGVGYYSKTSLNSVRCVR